MPSGSDVIDAVSPVVPIADFFKGLWGAAGSALSASEKAYATLEAIASLLTQRALWIRFGLLGLGNFLIVVGIIIFLRKPISTVAKTAAKVGEVAAVA